MKKYDLHIHTIKGVSDRDFDFSMDVLRDYVQKMHIDVIAITNHNLFDYNNFMVIQRELSNTIVLPGIEVDLEKGQIDVTSLSKDDLMQMVRAALEDDDFEIDEYDEGLLPNPAHKIIYKHLGLQLEDIHSRKNEFQEAKRNIFKDAYEKYCQ